MKTSGSEQDDYYHSNSEPLVLFMYNQYTLLIVHIIIFNTYNNTSMYCHTYRVMPSVAHGHQL